MKDYCIARRMASHDMGHAREESDIREMWYEEEEEEQ